MRGDEEAMQRLRVCGLEPFRGFYARPLKSESNCQYCICLGSWARSEGNSTVWLPITSGDCMLNRQSAFFHDLCFGACVAEGLRFIEKLLVAGAVFIAALGTWLSS